MDKSLLNGLTTTTPVLLDGYTENNNFEGWDTFSGEFIYAATEDAKCRARLAPGQTVPGYTDCYIQNNTIQAEGLVMRARVTGMGFIHTTTTRIKFYGDSADNLVLHKVLYDPVKGRYKSWMERGTSMSATLYAINTTTIPFVQIQERATPPECPTMPLAPGGGYTTWYIDAIRPTMCGKTVSLLEIIYCWKTLSTVTEE